jgi:hypothetical protein
VAFQYGKTSNYGSSTKPVAIGAGSQGVSALITGLQPGTTYHFRLVVVEGSYSPVAHYSIDAIFITAQGSGGGGNGGGSGNGGGGGKGAKHGKVSLTSRKLKVKSGVASIGVKCSGASGAQCKGKFSLAVPAKIGTKLKSFGCGSKSFSASAPHKQTVKVSLSKTCKTLLRIASKHKLGAKLTGTFSGGQKALKASVTLAG